MATVPNLLRFTALLLLIGGWWGSASAWEWKPLAADGVHDPDSPAMGLLQEPKEALSQLPPDSAGNGVRWVQALRDGYIDPRTNILPGTETRKLGTSILMMNTGDAAFVLFPHAPHTEWLDCSNCHDHIFAAKAGATPISMLAILSGEFCGRCHGAVAFPLTECSRCHSVPYDAGMAAEGRRVVE